MFTWPVKSLSLGMPWIFFLNSAIIIESYCTTIAEEKQRIIIGCMILITNLLLLAFLNALPSMRRCYIFFTLVTIGDILDGIYLIYPSVMRIINIRDGVFEEDISQWNCACKGYVISRIVGTELVSLTMLMMSVEKVLAVLCTFRYRRYVTEDARLIAALSCVTFCLLSLSAMFLTSYFGPQKPLQPDRYCDVAGSTVEGFAMFHQFFNLFCQVGAFLCSAFAFLSARKLIKQTSTKEINAIRPIFAVSFISCVVISSDSIIYILKYLIEVDINNVLENYAVTYISAAFQVSKFALYILAGEDFRDTLRKIVQNLSCCKVRRSNTIIKMQSSSAIKTTTSAK
ncbi:hypothetical protein GCK32_009130 [Trichostrongylus colubriformis]|uniref:G-protein coupled receptors family 1 profile domain-containing protein n=1 Tax=Trichostrongylus colubriformis TaxID=6319 RepID=A0AAN8GDG2_TRICO